MIRLTLLSELEVYHKFEIITRRQVHLFLTFAEAYEIKLILTNEISLLQKLKRHSVTVTSPVSYSQISNTLNFTVSSDKKMGRCLLLLSYCNYRCTLKV